MVELVLTPHPRIVAFGRTESASLATALPKPRWLELSEIRLSTLLTIACRHCRIANPSLSGLCGPKTRRRAELGIAPPLLSVSRDVAGLHRERLATLLAGERGY